ncbi:hypothetical protein A2875_04570 [Candidatus Gottesmanbacteria bacterium RIFCSPHIGHO2_01_FULL_46_14]|uniref:Uncharacterized protein n=1 Tax=Candidatus Gottesmanbacteria bacterium RIFCSPHIGHO2_01_FULL_46_14 TaxID=1798380 RepID=A0A1F5ZKF3_9BACT|nr:MAG: hypothetical protein A2875_04570 [Candidatus Gottesmanbacteria bacterium RIFCSPHIGHO2_01_FULL_46_14]
MHGESLRLTPSVFEDPKREITEESQVAYFCNACDTWIPLGSFKQFLNGMRTGASDPYMERVVAHEEKFGHTIVFKIQVNEGGWIEATY